jgi:hypothetical protein
MIFISSKKLHACMRACIHACNIYSFNDFGIGKETKTKTKFMCNQKLFKDTDAPIKYKYCEIACIVFSHLNVNVN